MDKKVIDSIKKIIKDQLPGMAAGEMKAFFQEVEELRKDFTALEKASKGLTKQAAEDAEERNGLCDTITELQNIIRQHADLDARIDVVNEREKEVEKKELSASADMSNLKAEEAEKRAALAERLVEKVFSNEQIVIHKSKTVPVAVESSPGCQSVQEHSETEVETQKKEKE